MDPRIALVWRSGGDYRREHVDSLVGQLRANCDLPIVVFSDQSYRGADQQIPLVTDWPGWWSKLELTRRDIRGDFLFFDLDTLIWGRLDSIAKVRKLTFLQDPYRLRPHKQDPEGISSGMMYLPEADRWRIWDAWRPECMATYRGDQDFFRKYAQTCDRWQDVCPGQIFSFKAEIRGKPIPPDTRVIYYHGKPRPWETAGRIERLKW